MQSPSVATSTTRFFTRRLVRATIRCNTMSVTVRGVALIGMWCLIGGAHRSGTAARYLGASRTGNERIHLESAFANQRDLATDVLNANRRPNPDRCKSTGSAPRFTTAVRGGVTHTARGWCPV